MAKTKKELGLDSMGVQKSMRMTDYLGDGLGQMPLNIMSGLVGQLTYFYTEKVDWQQEWLRQCFWLQDYRCIFRSSYG
ncbi:MAG: hypothetical protein ACLVB1_03530 [Blautia obeum]